MTEWHDDLVCPHCSKSLADLIAEVSVTHQYAPFSNLGATIVVPVSKLIPTMVALRDKMLTELGTPVDTKSEFDWGSSSGISGSTGPPADGRTRISGIVESELTENKGYVNFKIKDGDGTIWSPQGIKGEVAQRAKLRLRVGDPVVIEGVPERGKFNNIRKAEIKEPAL